ncbi:ATP-binding protein [bacterium]|nr:ATP-binding protein [bacterium]
MIERPLYLEKLISYKDKPTIKVITGIRRCGKSSILDSFIDYLKQQGIEPNHIIKMNFEDLIYDDMDYKKLNQTILDKMPNDRHKVYIILDEIQRIASWEKVVNSLHLNPLLDLYLTGSNAYLLSSELSTFLSGRYIEIKMLPLSFKEFLTFYDFSADTPMDKKFANYMRFGGMPALKDYNFDEKQSRDTLDSIYNTVIVKDVLSRSAIKDVSVLERLTRFMADNIGNMTSINKITNYLVSEKSLSSPNNKLIEAYTTSLENAFIFYPVKRYDIKGKEFLKSLNKFYIVDSGLRTYLLGRVRDTGRILENIVYFELLRRGYNVSVGKIGDMEKDFIATRGEEKVYIQVSDELTNTETMERELASLQAIRDSFEKIILTMDYIHTGTTEEGIKVIHLIDWLLEN